MGDVATIAEINKFCGFSTNSMVSCHHFRFLNRFLLSISVTYSKSTLSKFLFPQLLKLL